MRAFAIVLTAVAAASCAGGTADGARSKATLEDRCTPLRHGEPGCEAGGKVYPEHCPKPKAEWCLCQWVESDPTLALGVVASVKPTIVRSIGWVCEE